MLRINSRHALPTNKSGLAKQGSHHMLMLSQTPWLSLADQIDNLQKGGIHVTRNGTFIAYVDSYEDIMNSAFPQIVLHKHKPLSKKNSELSKKNSQSNSIKLNVRGISHVWNLTYPKIGLKKWEMPYFRQILRQRLKNNPEVGDNIYKSHLANSERHIKKIINSEPKMPRIIRDSLKKS